MPTNPYQVVYEFEKVIADYAGSRYAVALESCTAAIFLSLLWMKKEFGGKLGVITIPKRTYPSVPASIIHAGGNVEFSEEKWGGSYLLEPYNITDGALKFKRGMYKGGLHCLSFHIKKLLPIGRGGMILTDNYDAAEWFKLMRFDGRHPVPLQEDNFTVLGYNFYMTPEQAAKGLQLFAMVQDKDLPDLDVEEQGYPNLSQFDIYKKEL